MNASHEAGAVPPLQAQVPLGKYVQLGISQIDEGKLLTSADIELARTLRSFIERAKQNNAYDSKAEITIKIGAAFRKNSTETIEIGYSIKSALPAMKSEATLAKATAGLVLVQPEGSSASDPHQMGLRFYHSNGTVAGELRPGGEVVEPAHLDHESDKQQEN